MRRHLTLATSVLLLAAGCGGSATTRTVTVTPRLRPIVVETPAANTRVGTTFRVAGTASVFEATLVIQLVRNGEVLVRRTVTASEGAPGRGTFDSTFHATPGALTIRAFAPSAADGSPQHEVVVPVTVGP